MVVVVRAEGEEVKVRVQEHTSDTSSRDKSARHNDTKMSYIIPPQLVH